MHLFTILAVRDISKSEFSESEKLNAAKIAQGERNLHLDEQLEDSTSLGLRSNYYTNTRCLKFILSPATEIHSSELITAFEFNGHIDIPLVQNTTGYSWLEGCHLEVHSLQLEFSRNVLLLNSSQCKIIIQGSVNIALESSEFSFCDDEDINALLQDQDIIGTNG